MKVLEEAEPASTQLADISSFDKEAIYVIHPGSFVMGDILNHSSKIVLIYLIYNLTCCIHC